LAELPIQSTKSESQFCQGFWSILNSCLPPAAPGLDVGEAEPGMTPALLPVRVGRMPVGNLWEKGPSLQPGWFFSRSGV
jgi:hypothetical protein